MRWLGGGGIAAAVIALAVGLGQLPGGAAVLPAAAGSVASASGTATHYLLLKGGGNCSYPAPPTNRLFVALSPQEYDGAAPCGSYLLVKGAHGTVRVKVIDQCPKCKPGHIDLSETAFGALAHLGAGTIHVSYHTIANPPLPATVAFLVQGGSSQYWLAFIVMNTGNPIASVQLRTGPDSWLNLTHASWNGWVAPQGDGLGPFTVRVTDTLHHQVTIGNIALKTGTVQHSKTWMYGHN